MHLRSLGEHEIQCKEFLIIYCTREQLTVFKSRPVSQSERKIITGQFYSMMDNMFSYIISEIYATFSEGLPSQFLVGNRCTDTQDCAHMGYN